MRDTTNLNRWHRVAYRRMNQWLRRRYWTLRPQARQELWSTLMRRARYEPRTADDTCAIQSLNWRLGTASPYRFTPAQEAAQVALVEEFLAECRAAEGATA